MKKRSWPEITIDILEATLAPSNKMRIMYKSNLNFERFNRYFGDLLNKGFIRKDNYTEKRRLYIITGRGKTLLDALKKAEDLLFY